MKKITTVLIVDDNMDFAKRIEAYLSEIKKIDFVSIAENYAEAEQMLRLDWPSVVILDINLPDKSGISLLKHIQQKKINCHVIVLTNHFEDTYRKECIENGATNFLDKTNDFEKVASLVNKLLGE